tara:strand:+ start:10412 stop:10870 length:459 start_codon:yes stop_codon:yes gene_type:complete
MNIFILDANVVDSARFHNDKHVVKMVLETAQILCSTFEKGEAPYRRTHYNHPCSKWARESRENYEWLLNFGDALSKEYSKRFGKIHKSSLVINWCRDNIDKIELPSKELTKFALAMPEEYRTNCTVTSYRNYYMGEKRSIAKWKCEQPWWWK